MTIKNIIFVSMKELGFDRDTLMDKASYIDNLDNDGEYTQAVFTDERNAKYNLWVNTDFFEGDNVVDINIYDEIIVDISLWPRNTPNRKFL